MKKHLGQHFLFDPRILGRIADAVGFAPGDPVLEIGPGKGTLSRELLARGARLTAIERDPPLVALLEARLPEIGVISGDALEVDWHAAVGRPERWFVAGNIPYYITSPLIDKALTPPRPAAIVFLVQREVADRLVAAPDTPEYGALSVGVQVVARVRRLFGVPAGAFRPAPKVESAVVRIEPTVGLLAETEMAGFRRFVVGLFGARRKQLIRGLRIVTGGDATRAEAVLARAGIEPTARPETVDPGRFVTLYRAVVDAGGSSALAL